MRILLSTLVGLGALVAGGVFLGMRYGGDAPPAWRTAAVARGDLVVTINATGVLQPEEVVDVGAQVVGRINRFGDDPSAPTKLIDYGSTVAEGTELAYIDDAVYRAQLDQATANLLRAQRDLGQLRAKLLQAENDRQRAEQLLAANERLRRTDDKLRVISGAEYDQLIAAHKVAEANVQVGEALVKQAEAAVRLAQTNLDYTVIKSPVKGVIVDRRVNIGQTVVASLNAPSLFLIAKDLRRMQVWAAVNEADIARITEGQKVRFRVDAFPNDEFAGTVIQVRLNANMTQNVVTYPVVVAFDNTDLKLRPYMTASLRFEAGRRDDVLLVPNAAVRWKPRPEQIVPEARSASPSPGEGKRGPGGKPRDKGGDERGRVWVADGNFVRPLEVRVGLSDGSQTEVESDELIDGESEVVVGAAPVSAGTETTNPFAPKIFRGRPQPKERPT